MVDYVRPVRVLPEAAPAPMQAPEPAPIPEPVPVVNAMCVAEILRNVMPQQSVYDSVISVMGLNLYPMQIDFGAGTQAKIIAVKLTRLSDGHAGYAYLTAAAVQSGAMKLIRASGEYKSEMVAGPPQLPAVVAPAEEVESVEIPPPTREQFYENLTNLSRESTLVFDVSVARSMIVAMLDFSNSNPDGLDDSDYAYFCGLHQSILCVYQSRRLSSILPRGSVSEIVRQHEQHSR